MGPGALLIATACYVVTAITLARKRDWAMCLVFAAYSLANFGLIWAIVRRP
jgi:hypothetical protein